MHDGSLLCFVAGVQGVSWSIDFEHPVVAIFDIAHPNPIDDEDRPQPLLLEHPHPLLVQDLPLDFVQLQALPESTFIGRIGHDFFAMSRDNYPLVPFAPAVVTKELGPGSGPEGHQDDNDDGAFDDADVDKDQVPNTCQGADCLLGRHRVQPPIVAGNTDAVIEAPSSPLLIEAPSTQNSPRVQPTSVTPNRSSPHLPDRSTVLASLTRPVRQISNGDANPTLVMLLLAVLGYVYVSKLRALNRQSKVVDTSSMPDVTSSRSSSKVILSPDMDKGEAKLPAAPPQDIPAAMDASSTRPSTPPMPALTLGPSNGSPARLRSESLSMVMASPSLKALPPLPPPNGADMDGEGESDDGKDGKEGTGPRRKGRRRRGKKQKKQAALSATAGEPTGLGVPNLLNGTSGAAEDSASDKELSKLTLSETEVKDDAMDEIIIPPAKLGGPQFVGGLTVTDAILGKS